eukprot:6371830-Amphidinium_carterae.1
MLYAFRSTVLVLAEVSSCFVPTAINNFRIAGESPSRVIRRTGAVHIDNIVKVLAKSGVENRNQK